MSRSCCPIPISAVVLAAPVFVLACAAGEERRHVPPSITFSADERTVTIEYKRGEFVFPRPVVSPWKYEAPGKVLWVAPDGNDAGAGTADRPFRTFAKAIAVVEPGDIVYAKAGTYVEILTITKSGREGMPIIISCAQGYLGKVKITPPKQYVEKNPGCAVVTLHTAQHVWINGLIIEGPLGRPEAPKSETFGANGITWSGKGGFGCRATNNVVYANVHCGLKEMGHGGTRILMEGNVIFANGTSGTDHGIYCPGDESTMNGNIIFHNAGYGIHSYSQPKQQLITRNICMGNAAGGIILGGTENKVFHNVCVDNGFGLIYFRGACTHNVVRNNIFAFNRMDCGYDNGGGKEGDPARNLDDYNCYFPGQPSQLLQPGKHEILGNPAFRDPQRGDYRLKAGSPCRGKGASLGIPSKRKPPDVGAF